MISERVALMFTGMTWFGVGVAVLWAWWHLERPATKFIWFGALVFTALGGYWTTRGVIFPRTIPSTGVIVNMLAAGWLITGMLKMALEEMGQVKPTELEEEQDA